MKKWILCLFLLPSSGLADQCMSVQEYKQAHHCLYLPANPSVHTEISSDKQSITCAYGGSFDCPCNYTVSAEKDHEFKSVTSAQDNYSRGWIGDRCYYTFTHSNTRDYCKFQQIMKPK